MIKQKSITVYVFMLFMMNTLLFSPSVKAQQVAADHKSLSLIEQSIIKVASLTAKGDLDQLKIELNKALDAGLTLNETKEVLVHAYAYCGFPRSIRALQTLMDVTENRKAKGINDHAGKDATKIQSQETKYNRGKNILGELTQVPQPVELSGYSAFSPVIDTFLKEHLFADIFERDILTYAQRELVTISVISAIGEAEPMLKSHFNITLKTGISPNQLQQFVEIIKSTIGKKEAKAAQKVLNEVLVSQK